MRISIFIDGIWGGGAERFASLLSSGLASVGHDVRLLTGPKRDEEYEISFDVKRVILYKKRSFLNNAYLINRYNRDNDIEICIAVGIYANLAVALSSIIGKTKVVICERSAPHFDHLSRKTKLLRKLLYNRGDAFVFQTLEAKSFFCRRIQRRSVIIPNPIKPGLPCRGSETRKEIVAIGRLSAEKNYSLLLEAFAAICKSHDDYSLYIYGKGGEKGRLIKEAEDLGINDHVHFEGFVDDVHRRVADADIFVLSSDYEGLPNSLIEAMAMGFPVISTNCGGGGPKMLIENGVNGLLVPPNDVQALADAILLYIEDPQLKEKCSKNARLIYNRCSMEVVMNQWDSFLRQQVS